MSKKYTLLIDESGDQGLERVMTHEQPFGASSYLTMGAVLVPTTLLPSVREQLDGVRSKLGVTQLHCTDMNHLNVAYLAKTMSRLRILAFGVISKKSTLGDYRKMIEGKKQAQDYYNKCSQYLFELVAMFCSEHGLGSADIEILFEEKRGHDYQRLAHYLGAIANKPIDSRAAKLYHLSPFIINAKNKADEPALAVADLIAYALHKSFCSENNRLRLTEQRYLREIKSNFYKHPQNSQIANHGIKFIKGPVAMGLSGEEMSFAMKFYNKSDVT